VSPCPHCRALAVISPHPKLRWVCGACGGPRVPADVPGHRGTDATVRVLASARRKQAAAFGMRAATILFALVAVLGVGLGAILWIPAHAAALVVGGFGTAALMLAFFLSKRAAANDRGALAEVDRAWTMVADEIMRAVKRDVTPRELSEWMRTDEAHAEKMLTELSATDRVRLDVGDDAELRFSPNAPNDGGPRVAIDEEEENDAGARREERRER
jgi:hypothetical protein